MVLSISKGVDGVSCARIYEVNCDQTKLMMSLRHLIF